MGLLDELEQEAERRRNEEAKVAADGLSEIDACRLRQVEQTIGNRERRVVGLVAGINRKAAADACSPCHVGCSSRPDADDLGAGAEERNGRGGVGLIRQRQSVGATCGCGKRGVNCKALPDRPGLGTVRRQGIIGL